MRNPRESTVRGIGNKLSLKISNCTNGRTKTTVLTTSKEVFTIKIWHREGLFKRGENIGWIEIPTHQNIKGVSCRIYDTCQDVKAVRLIAETAKETSKMFENAPLSIKYPTWYVEEKGILKN